MNQFLIINKELSNWMKFSLLKVNPKKKLLIMNENNKIGKNKAFPL